MNQASPVNCGESFEWSESDFVYQIKFNKVWKGQDSSKVTFNSRKLFYHVLIVHVVKVCFNFYFLFLLSCVWDSTCFCGSYNLSQSVVNLMC